jgi:hypothetical protein
MFMVKFTVVQGDFAGTDWELNGEILSSGFYNKKEIQISEVISLIQKAKIGKDVYVDFELGTTQTFTAKMREEDYKKVYDKFLSVGNNPQQIKLPMQKKSIRDVFWSAIGVFFIISLVSGGSDDTNGSSSNSNDWADVDAITYCEIALKNAAKYGARVPFGANKTASPYPSNKNKFSVIMGAEIKNAYGTWAKSTVSCVVNGESVDKLVVDGSVIWDH